MSLLQPGTMMVSACRNDVAGRRLHRYTPDSRHWAGVDGAYAKVIPFRPELRPRQTKQLNHNAELKRAKPLIDQGYHPMAKGISGHGSNLSYIVISAYRPMCQAGAHSNSNFNLKGD